MARDHTALPSRLEVDHTDTERVAIDSVIQVDDCVFAVEVLVGPLKHGYMEAPVGAQLQVLYIGTDQEESGWLYVRKVTADQAQGWVSRALVCGPFFSGCGPFGHRALDHSSAAADPSAPGSIATEHATCKTVVEHCAASGDTGGSSSTAAAEPFTLNGRVPEDDAEQRRAADGERYTKQEFCEWYGQNKGIDRWNEASRLPTPEHQPSNPRTKDLPTPTASTADMSMQCSACDRIICDIENLAFWRHGSQAGGVDVHLILKPDIADVPAFLCRMTKTENGAVASWQCVCGHKMGDTRNIGPKKAPTIVLKMTSVKLCGYHWHRASKNVKWSMVDAHPEFPAIEVLSNFCEKLV